MHTVLFRAHCADRFYQDSLRRFPVLFDLETEQVGSGIYFMHYMFVNTATDNLNRFMRRVYVTGESKWVFVKYTNVSKSANIYTTHIWQEVWVPPLYLELHCNSISVVTLMSVIANKVSSHFFKIRDYISARVSFLDIEMKIQIRAPDELTNRIYAWRMKLALRLNKNLTDVHVLFRK